MKNKYKKIKEIGILAACDFAAITVSVLLSLLVANGAVEFRLDLPLLFRSYVLLLD